MESLLHRRAADIDCDDLFGSWTPVIVNCEIKAEDMSFGRQERQFPKLTQVMEIHNRRR